MPFRSTAQQRFMYARHPQIARRWTDEMRGGRRASRYQRKHPIKAAGLPDRVGKFDLELVDSRTNRGAANVGKRLVDEETRTSPTRAAVASAGAASIAWGGSRSHALGRGLRRGAVNSQLDPSVQRALVAAERARHMIETSTEPLGRITGRGIGRMPKGLRTALESVPRPLRPATATLAGAILIEHARPIRRKSYTPVVNR